MLALAYMMDQLSPEEARGLLSRSWVGSLGTARASEAHVIPVTYAYDGQRVLLQPRGELEVSLTEETERACLLVTEPISETDWRYVTVHGELSATDDVDRATIEKAFAATPGGGIHDEAIGIWILEPEEVAGFEHIRPLTGADDDMDIV